MEVESNTDNSDEVPENATFEELKLSPWLLKQLKAMSLKKPTSVQWHCIPAIFDKKFCIISSKTGSGKTLAFALPIIQTLSEDPYGVYALVLTPTRELAYQIADQFKAIGKPMNLRVCVITGGVDMVAQGLELSDKPHIIISTPGRLADHIQSSNTLLVNNIKYLVIDEADRLLGGGFNEQMKTIMDILPSKRQTLLFSATITDALSQVKAIAKEDYFFWESKFDVATVENLDQRYVLAPADYKDGYLVQIVHQFVNKHQNRSVMIFTVTMKKCEVIYTMFLQLGIECGRIHSRISQRERLASLANFKSSRVKVLIATDVCSRGLDIPTVDLVINHNVPRVPKDYVHRVGRTARAGREGMAITFVTQRDEDINAFKEIEKFINTKLVEFVVCEKDVLKILTQVAVTKRECEIKLDASDFDERKETYKKKRLIMQGLDPEEEEMKREERRKLKKKEMKRKRNKK